MRSKQRQSEPYWHCFRCAFAGVWQGLKTERNLGIHFILGSSAAVAGVALGLSATELAILTLIIVFVIALELINSSLEAAMDLVSPEFHPLARYVKDAAAGSVLVASVGAVIIAGLLLLPRLVHLVIG